MPVGLVRVSVWVPVLVPMMGVNMPFFMRMAVLVPKMMMVTARTMGMPNVKPCTSLEE